MSDPYFETTIGDVLYAARWMRSGSRLKVGLPQAPTWEQVQAIEEQFVILNAAGPRGEDLTLARR